MSTPPSRCVSQRPGHKRVLLVVQRYHRADARQIMTASIVVLVVMAPESAPQMTRRETGAGYRYLWRS